MIEKIDAKFILNKFSSNKEPLSTKEATEILGVYGLAKDERATRALISRKDKPLKAEFKKPGDRREGYVIKHKDLYDFITQEIPLMKEIFDILAELKKQELSEVKKAKAGKKVRTKQVAASKTEGTTK